MAKKNIDDINPKGKRVLVRVDFNVPLDDNRNVTDDTRIRAALPTIQSLVDRGGRVILMSHLGRPKGQVKEEFRLEPAAKSLSTLLKKPVTALKDCIGDEVKNAVNAMQDGDVVLLENLRFHPEEEKNDPAFCKQLAELGDLYVNDAFGTAHRAHASTEGVTRFFDTNVAGYLMQKEIEYLVGALETPARPFIAILGGLKISGKIDVITNLLEKVDGILIGGAMAYTLLKVKGIDVGDSIVEVEKLDVAKETLAAVEAKGVSFLLPEDHKAATEVKDGIEPQVIDAQSIPTGLKGIDIGPATIKRYEEEIAKAKTIVWNGPMGVFEIPAFAEGTIRIAKAVAASNAVTIVGGGDSVSAVNQIGVSDQITHISTGGGASLELLEGKVLPGLAALSDK
ncbi:MAG: phosphoglycerate kinase [Candidatus Omnitrophota bacterium]|jgi:phosphoglycerate kinase|nr:MAG: phosphoglycerate kinase [Candidatus Omnitrophota bacterium]